MLLLATACAEKHTAVIPNPDQTAPMDASPADAGSDSSARTARGEAIDWSCLAAQRDHRTRHATCDRERGRLDPPGSRAGDAECQQDSDCDAGVNGRCLPDLPSSATCSYDECFRDSDCPQGQACLCGATDSIENNRCVPSNCQTDADCTKPAFCSASLGECTDLGIAGFYCLTCDDECSQDADCHDPQAHCMFDPELTHWRCSKNRCE